MRLAGRSLEQAQLISWDSVVSAAGGSVIRSSARSRTLLPFGVRASTFTTQSQQLTKEALRSHEGTTAPSPQLEYAVRYAMRNRPRLEVRSDWQHGLESVTPEVVTAPAWRSPSRARGRQWSLHPGCLSAT